MAGNNLPWVPRINATKVVTVTPTITANSAYAAGNQIGGIMTITDVVRQDTNQKFGTSELVEVTILDAQKQDSPIDVWFFNQSPTVTSTDHAAFAMTYANMQNQLIGVVQLGATGTYSDANATSACTTANLNMPLQVASTVANPTNIYAIAICRGTPTYTSTTSLTFLFKLFLD